MTSSALSKRAIVASRDGNGATLEEARSETNELSVAELERANASLKTQTLMLRGGLQDQAAKLARAREVQALTAAQFEARLAAMESEIARLQGELALVKQGPLRRVGGPLLRRAARYLPTRAPSAEGQSGRSQTDEAVMRVRRALSSPAAAWKALLSKRG